MANETTNPFEDYGTIVAELEKSGNVSVDERVHSEDKKADETKQELETKPVDEVKKDETKVQDETDKTTDKPGDKSDDKVEQVDDKEAEAQTEEIVKEVSEDIRKSKKDFTDIDKEDIPFFSKMSLSAFNRLKPVYLEHKKQKVELEQQTAELTKLRSGALPESYFEHPMGYTLTPEFGRAANLYSQAQMIKNHWEQQFNRIRSGEETYQEIHQNPRTGELYLGKPVQVTKESENEVQQWLKGSETQLMKVGAAIESLSNNHKTRFKEANDTINDFENKSFKQFADKKNEAILNDTINQVFHPVFHSNPLVKGYAKALLTIQALGEFVKKQGEELKSLKEGKTTTTNGTATIKPDTDKAKAGPNNSSMASGNGKNSGADNVTIEDFNEVMMHRR